MLGRYKAFYPLEIVCAWLSPEMCYGPGVLAVQGCEFCSVALKNIVSGDGDAKTPIEELSWGRVSRRMCCRYMNHLITTGTPCHVSQKPEATSGSDNTVVARHKPGIAFEMIGDMPSFKSPVTGKLFRSKSYVAYDISGG